MVYIFSLQFSGSKFSINLRRQFCVNKIFSIIWVKMLCSHGYKPKIYKRLTWREHEFSDVAQGLLYLLCRHFFVNLTLLRKISLRKFKNGAGKENLKLPCPVFKRAILELVNSKKTNKEVVAYEWCYWFTEYFVSSYNVQRLFWNPYL